MTFGVYVTNRVGFFGLLLVFQSVAFAQVELRGEPLQGGLITGTAPAGSTVVLDGRPLMTSPQGHFVFGIGREDTDARELAVQLPDGTPWRQQVIPQPRDFDIQRVDGLPPAQVTPPAAALERIRDDGRLIGQARQRFQARTDWLGDFEWPVIGRITGVYGSQRILNGEPRRPHFGVDIAAPEGTPIMAPAPGIVTMVHPDMYYSGATLLIDHGHGISTTYLHMSEISVSAGQRVAKGDVIGKVGATGRATGPHLCWRLNWGDVRLDPALLVPDHVQ